MRSLENDHEQAEQQGADDDPGTHPDGAAAQRGDKLSYSVQGDRVILTKANHTPAGNPFATFDEWSSEDDREAYARR